MDHSRTSSSGNVAWGFVERKALYQLGEIWGILSLGRLATFDRKKNSHSNVMIVPQAHIFE